MYIFRNSRTGDFRWFLVTKNVTCELLPPLYPTEKKLEHGQRRNIEAGHGPLDTMLQWGPLSDYFYEYD